MNCFAIASAAIADGLALRITAAAVAAGATSHARHTAQVAKGTATNLAMLIIAIACGARRNWRRSSFAPVMIRAIGIAAAASTKVFAALA